VIVIKTFFSKCFLLGLAVGLLTALSARFKMKKKKEIPNLGMTPASLGKAARRQNWQ